MKRLALIVTLLISITPEGVAARPKHRLASNPNPTYSAWTCWHDDTYGPCVTWDAHYDCFTPDDFMARDICTIHTPQGQQTAPYDINVVFDTAGGHCGYREIKVTCHLPTNLSATSEIRGIQLPCGAGREQAAAHFCATSSPPAQTFRVWQSGVSSGGSCGYTWARTVCYR